MKGFVSGANISREEGGGERVWEPKVVYPKWPNKILPTENFRFFPRWSLWRGGGSRGGDCIRNGEAFAFSSPGR